MKLYSGSHSWAAGKWHLSYECNSLTDWSDWSCLTKLTLFCMIISDLQDCLESWFTVCKHQLLAFLNTRLFDIHLQWMWTFGLVSTTVQLWFGCKLALCKCFLTDWWMMDRPTDRPTCWSSSSSSSWCEAFSQSLLLFLSSARTVCPPPATVPQSLWYPCHGRSGESGWWASIHRHVSIPAMAACHLSPWCRSKGSDRLVQCAGVWQCGWKDPEFVTCWSTVIIYSLLSVGAVTAARSQLVYHRLDLLPTDSNCMHFKQLATFSESRLQ